MMNRFSLTSMAAAAALAVAFALPADAAPFQVSAQNTGNVHGTNGSANMTITPGGGVSAGAFAVNAAPFGGDFTAWCLDLANFLDLPSSYEVTSAPFAGNPLSAAVQSTVKALFDTAYSGLTLTNANNSAGFQLALWEIITETSGTYDVTDGTFKATNYGGNDISGVITAATGFLTGLGGPTTGNYTVTYLQSVPDVNGNVKQSLVTVAPIPLPAAGLLLFGALGGLGVVARRRKSAEA